MEQGRRTQVLMLTGAFLSALLLPLVLLAMRRAEQAGEEPLVRPLLWLLLALVALLLPAAACMEIMLRRERRETAKHLPETDPEAGAAIRGGPQRAPAVSGNSSPEEKARKRAARKKRIGRLLTALSLVLGTLFLAAGFAVYSPASDLANDLTGCTGDTFCSSNDRQNLLLAQGARAAASFLMVVGAVMVVAALVKEVKNRDAQPSLGGQPGTPPQQPARCCAACSATTPPDARFCPSCAQPVQG